MHYRIARRRVLSGIVALAVVGGALPVFLAAGAASATDPCAPPEGNPITCENALPGSPPSEWETSPLPSSELTGFTTEFSVDAGETVHFKVKAAAGYTMDIYRMGYYGGDGARKVASLTPVLRTQPDCLANPSTGLVDCGNWQESASWPVPSGAVSGVYFAHIVDAADPGVDNHIYFVVRDDSSHSDVLVQTSDTTWQAYNQWGGNSLYTGDPAGRAYQVSYNRPFSTRTTSPRGRDFLFSAEYPLIRFLERNGYDASYLSGQDTDRRGSLLTQHRVFVSSGHDEYWSAAQRANVEAARDAGVNLAFLSGNELLWKTRWEDSIDGSGTPYRTLVTYKETHDDAKTDPTPVWTGTWRDPRFPTGESVRKPENALTGTLWMVNCCSSAIKVPAADGKMRLWRDTAVASQSAGEVATMPAGTLGFEWDSDADNGFRPSGLIDLSTTTENVEEYVQDLGTHTGKGTATHHLTMYRAASGALVFSAGSVQWSWGLDDVHDGAGETPTASTAMQQATVNLLADMQAQPKTLQSDLVTATASTDHTAPQSNVTSPAPDAQVANGSTVQITGTASDLGGGRVGGVEVSTDGGSSWHPASGRENWTYAWHVTGNGTVSIKTRATDDSLNTETPGVGTSAVASCPCSIYGEVSPSGSAFDKDESSLELGVRFQSSVGGWVTGVRFYKGSGNTGTHLGHLWAADGSLLAAATFTDETAIGWQSVRFAAPVHISADTTYVVSYWDPNGHYYASNFDLVRTGRSSPPLTALRDGDGGGNGVYHVGSASAFPDSTYHATSYWVDVTFATVAPGDTTKPTVVDTVPMADAASVPVSATPKVTFSEPVEASTVHLTVTDVDGAAVDGTVAYDEASRVATFTPSAALLPGNTYTVAVTGAADLAAPANVMDPFTFSFDTVHASTLGDCPCSIWPDTATPATASVDDPHSVELGVKFRTSTNGFIEGVRFYKGPNNTGTHIGTLWGQDGTELASAAFSETSSTGWQTVTFASKVPVVAGRTYVASYHTDTGWYSMTGHAFDSAVVRGPLTALADGQDGPNGVFRYGSRGFPSEGVGTNYYVDVVFTLGSDSTPPTVTSTSPAANATSVRIGTAPSAAFDEPLSTSGTLTVKDAEDRPVPGATAYDPATQRLTFTPSDPLAAGTAYTATVSGAVDDAGNPLAGPYTWSFTTSGVSTCPCTLFPSDAAPATPPADDGNAVELGTRFTADSDGYVSGVRFYRGAGNTGTHVGSLWKADGTRLATATFGSENAGGWQSVTFANPVAVTAGAAYVASYFAPNGHYSITGGFFSSGAYDNAPLHAPADSASAGNGVYTYTGSPAFPEHTYNATNYWIGPIFSTFDPSDTTPPEVTSTTPADGATGVAAGVNPSATFSEAVQPSTVHVTVTGPGGASVSGSVGYQSSTRRATFSPSGDLAAGTAYTVTVSGAKDLSGNTLAGAATWSFSTAAAAPASCPCTIWPDTATPAQPSAEDSSPVELGLRLRSDVDGTVTGIRFYKGAANTGTHIGHLWSNTGTLLASVTFTGESASGWQQATLSSPVAVTAGTTYVVSYYAPNGGYAYAGLAFADAGLDAAPLHALKSGVDGANGVYLYGRDAFPTESYHATNYWVDVVFTEST